jgi:hypothetical protein
MMNGCLDFLVIIARLSRDGLPTKEKVELMTRHIETYMNDIEFHRALATLTPSRSAMDRDNSDAVLRHSGYQRMGRDIFDLLLSIVAPENENILIGIGSRNSRKISEQVVKAVLQYGSPRDELRYWFPAYIFNISLAGLAHTTSEGLLSCNLIFDLC